MDEYQLSQGSPAGWHDDPQDPTGLHYWDGLQWTDNRSPKPPTTEATATPPSWSANRVVAAVGAVAALLGSIMPWASMTTPFGTLTVNGTSNGGDGLFTAGAAMIILILLLTQKYLPALVVATLTAVLLTFDVVDLSRLEAVNENAVSSVGWGLYLTIAGIAVVIVATILLYNDKRTAKSS